MSKSFFIFNLRIARVENNLNCRCKIRRYKNNNYVAYTKLYYCWICWWSGSISFRGLAVILFFVYFYACVSVSIMRGIGSPDPAPPWKITSYIHKLYGFLIKLSKEISIYIGTPHSPPESVGPPLKSSKISFL